MQVAHAGLDLALAGQRDRTKGPPAERVYSTLDRSFQREVAQVSATAREGVAPASFSTCSVELVKRRTSRAVSARHSTCSGSKVSCSSEDEVTQAATEPW